MLSRRRFLTARLVCGRTCLHNDETASFFVATIKHYTPHSDQPLDLRTSLIYDPRFNLFDAYPLVFAWGTEINTKDADCGFEHTLTSLRFFMTAFKGLSSSGVFRLPGVGATIGVSRIVMALIIRPCANAIRGRVGGSGRV